MEKLTISIENTEKRAKVLENKVNGLKIEALQKRKAKDNRGMYLINEFWFDQFLYRGSSCNETNENVWERACQDWWHENFARAIEVYDWKWDNLLNLLLS